MTRRRYPVDAPASWVAVCKQIARRNAIARRPKPKRYPIRPLLDVLNVSLSQIHRASGFNGEQYRTVRDKGLTEGQADRICVAFGLHPMFVWRDWLDDLELVCADDSCGRRFVPARGNQKYCCPEHGHRVAQRNYERRRYQTDPVYREKTLARMRVYDAGSRRAKKVKRSVYYRENRERELAQKAAYREANREVLRDRQREYRARKAAA